MKKGKIGFTLIELMIVVAIIGILAMIALPAYQDYIARAKVTEALNRLGEFKTSISEYAASSNGMPTSAAVAGINTGAFGAHVSGATMTTTGETTVASVTLTAINPTVDGQTLSFSCTRDTATSAVTCHCFTASTDMYRYVPASCRNTS